MASICRIFEVGNSMWVSSPGSDVPEEAPLASYLYERSYLKKGRNKYCAKSTSRRGGRDASSLCQWQGGTKRCMQPTHRLWQEERRKHGCLLR